MQTSNNNAPKLELKKLKVFESRSQETTCYNAELWVNGKKSAICDNNGEGGADRFWPVDIELFELANQYVDTLPQRVSAHTMYKVDLEVWIGEQISAYFEEKSKLAFQKMVEKRMQKEIVISDAAGSSFRSFKLKVPLSDINFENPLLQGQLNHIFTQVRGQLKEGEKIINTNIPERFKTL